MPSSLKKESLQGMNLRALRELAKEHRLPHSSSLGRKALIERLLLLLKLQAQSKEELLQSARVLLVDPPDNLSKSELVLRLVTDDRARACLLEGRSGSGAGQSHADRRQREVSPRSILAFTLMAAGSLGMLLGVLGAAFMPVAGMRTDAWLKQNMTRMQNQAQSASALLRSVVSSLESGANALQDTEASLSSLGDTMEATEPFLASVETLVSKQAPETLETSQEAILSAATAAHSVDQFLRTLDSLRLITGVTYRPEAPLDESISDVAHTLAPLGPGFREVGDDLSLVRQELVFMRPELEQLQRDVEQLSVRLVPVIEALEEQAESLDALSAAIGQSEQKTSRVLTWIFGVLALGCLWEGVSQCAVFLVGRELWLCGRDLDEFDA